MIRIIVPMGGEGRQFVEYERTDKMFTAPSEKLTEDYLTGRFG